MATDYTIRSSSASERAHALLETGLYSDLELVVEYEGERNSLRAHRCILTLSSVVWASAIQWAEDGVIKITEYPFDIIKAIVYFAYTGLVTIQDLTQCQNILIAAHFYDMQELQIKCGEYIQNLFLSNKISVKDMIDIFNKGSLYNNQIIKLNCVAFIEDNTKKVFESAEFLNLSADSIKSILLNDRSLCPEDYLICSVLRWTKNSILKSGLEVNEENVYKFLIKSELLPLIRLDRLNEEELKAFRQDYPVIFSGEGNSEINLDATCDELASGVHSRSGRNEILDMRVIVECPPLEICEEFTYNGPSVPFSIYSLEIEPRINLCNSYLSGPYEEKFTVTLDDSTAYFDGVVHNRLGAIVFFPRPINLTLFDNLVLRFHIKLYKCGMYWKNSNFSFYGNGLLVRLKSGLIMKINDNVEKPSTSTELPV